MQRAHRDRLLLALPGLLLVGVLLAFLANGFQEGANVATPSFSHHLAARDIQPVAVAAASTVSRATPVAAVERALQERSFSAWPNEPALRQREHQLLLVDENGNRIARAAVTILARPAVAIPHASDLDLLGAVKTAVLHSDEDGQLSFLEDEADGWAYEAVVEAEGYAPKRYRLVDPGKKLIRVYRCARIAGHVRGLDEAPLAAVPVELHHDEDRLETVYTDAYGYYEFDKVIPEHATIRVLSSTHERAWKTVTSMAGGECYYRDFYLRPGLGLGVTVVDLEGHRVPEARVSLLELNSGLAVGREFTGRLGYAFFACLRDPSRYSYLLWVDAGPRGRARQQLEIPAMAAGQSSLTVTVTVRGVWALSGVIRTQEGLGIEGARVVFESDGLAPYRSSRHQVVVDTGPDGAYEATGLIEGLAYQATVIHSQFAVETVQGITQSTSGSGLDVPMRGRAAVEGFVYDLDGQPEANAVVIVRLRGVDETLAGSHFVVRTDKNGRYFVSGLPPGEVSIEAVNYRDGRTAHGNVTVSAEGDYAANLQTHVQ